MHAGVDAAEHVGEHEVEDTAEHAAADAAEGAAEGACSFAPSTLVTLPGGGEEPIASLKVGQAVLAYNPTTHASTSQAIQAVSLHHDDNLLDVTLRETTPVATSTGSAAKAAPAAAAHVSTTSTSPRTHDETVHTTSNHPWLTEDAGWESAGFLRIGEPVLRADGSTAVVVSIRSVAGGAAMWDLTVSDLHDFAVGDGQFVVHNCDVTDPEGQVGFGDTDLSREVKAARRDAGDIEHNYAAARLDNGEIRVARSTKGPYHAEEFLVDDAEGDGRTIKALYSERQPCANICAGYLMDHNPAMKVSWTWAWEGENPELSAEIREYMRGVIK